MEGGNGATIGSGITQFAEGEPKRLSCARTRMSPARGSPLPPKKILTRSRGVAEKASRKERKVINRLPLASGTAAA